MSILNYFAERIAALAPILRQRVSGKTYSSQARESMNQMVEILWRREYLNDVGGVARFVVSEIVNGYGFYVMVHGCSFVRNVTQSSKKSANALRPLFFIFSCF